MSEAAIEEWLSPFILLVVGVVLVIALVPVVRYLWQQRQRSPLPDPRQFRRSARKPTIIDVDISQDAQDAEPSAAASPSPETPPRQQRPSARRDRRSQRARRARRERRRVPRISLPMLSPRAVVALLLGALLLGGGMWYFIDNQQRRMLNQVVVLVAPFQDGSDGLTGVAVANELADTLQARSGGRFVVQRLNAAPASEDAARQTVVRQSADVLIWGHVQQGGLLNDTTLRPTITYVPSGAYAPNAWIGYADRFSLPHTYVLADEYINGAVILPRLLLALADYSQGQSDTAYTRLGHLLEEYPALDVSLFHVLRGNVLWARGSYEQAAAEYRQALASAPRHQAELASNLAAILLDARDASASESLQQATQLSGSGGLAALHFNVGLLALQQGNLEQASTQLEQARRLQPDSVPILLTLAAAYRETGQLAAAAEALQSAEQEMPGHIAAVPEQMQPLVQQSLQARLDAQRGLLRLAQQIDARGPLTWELEVAPPLPVDTAKSITEQLREAAAAAEALTAAWRARASADAAAQNLANQASEGVELVALEQVSRAEHLLDTQQYYLALALIEEGRARQAVPGGIFDSAWRMLAGGDDPLAEARELLATLTVTTPQDTPYLLADARALRLQYAADQADNAVYQRYDTIISIAPQQPAAYYGKGQLALLDGDREAARQLMQQALEQEPAYYPARLQLVAFAEEEGDWASALAHMQTLVQQYPGPQAELHLASVLRRSGPGGFEEAARVLQPLVEAGNTAAMVEMGRLFADNQQPDAAISFYEQARAAETLAPQALLELGHLLAATGEFARAEASFLQAIDAAQGETHMRASMAVAELYNGPLAQPARADDYYEQVLSSEVQDAAVLLNVGDRLMQHGKTQRAAEVYRRADRLQPDNPRIAYGLSEALLALGELQNASAQAQRVLDLTGGPEDAEIRAAALVNLGDVQRLSGNLENALGSYNQALALNAAHIEATLGLGQVAVARDNWAVALGHFQQALNLPGGAESALAQFWYAEALLRQHSLTQAIAHYEQAHALQPHFPAALLGLAQAQFMRGSSSEALTTVDRALQQQPDYGEAWLFKGKLFQQQEDLQAARNAYERAIQANDQLGEAYYRRGLIAMQQQEHEAAVSDLQRAAQLQPGNAEVYYWLGQANFALNRMAAAAEAFARAVELRNGSYAAAEFYLGMAEEARGQIDAAIASFESVIQQTNESEWVNRAQTELERIVNQ